eukprot:3236403-Rhodomonas_salina.1
MEAANDCPALQSACMPACAPTACPSSHCDHLAMRCTRWPRTRPAPVPASHVGPTSRMTREAFVAPDAPSSLTLDAESHARSGHLQVVPSVAVPGITDSSTRDLPSVCTGHDTLIGRVGGSGAEVVCGEQ